MVEEPIGIPAEYSDIRLQASAYAELVNKLAWALGSAYRVGYNRPKDDPRRTALAMARTFVADHGWPKYIQK